MSRASTIIRLGLAVDQLRTVNLNQIVDLTITFPSIQDPRELSRQIASFQRHVLNHSLRTRGLRVLSRSGSHYHFHCLIDVGTICGQGFCWEAFDRYKQLSSEHRLSPSPTVHRLMSLSRQAYQLSMSSWLRQLQSYLQRCCRNYGFGRCIVLPVRKNLDAVKYYFAGNLPQYRRQSEIGLRPFTSWKLPTGVRCCDFQAVTPGRTRYRALLTRFCLLLGLTCEQACQILPRINRRWKWHYRDLILNQERWTAPQQQQLDRLSRLVLQLQLCNDHPSTPLSGSTTQQAN